MMNLLDGYISKGAKYHCYWSILYLLLYIVSLL